MRSLEACQSYYLPSMIDLNATAYTNRDRLNFRPQTDLAVANVAPVKQVGITLKHKCTTIVLSTSLIRIFWSSTRLEIGERVELVSSRVEKYKWNEAKAEIQIKRFVLIKNTSIFRETFFLIAVNAKIHLQTPALEVDQPQYLKLKRTQTKT